MEKNENIDKLVEAIWNKEAKCHIIDKEFEEVEIINVGDSIFYNNLENGRNSWVDDNSEKDQKDLLKYELEQSRKIIKCKPLTMKDKEKHNFL